MVVGRKQVTYIGIRTKGKKVMSVHAVGVLLEKIYLFIYKFADNNQKMKGRTEEGKKSKQTVGCNFKSLNLPM